MLGLPMLMGTEELGKLMKRSKGYVASRIEDGQIKGLFSSGGFYAYRPRFYKDSGLYTDEEIEEYYRTAGLNIEDFKVKEKVAADNND